MLSRKFHRLLALGLILGGMAASVARADCLSDAGKCATGKNGNRVLFSKDSSCRGAAASYRKCVNAASKAAAAAKHKAKKSKKKVHGYKFNFKKAGSK